MSTAHYQSEPGNERRRERRISTSWLIEFFQSGTKDTLGQAAVAIDLSREGLRLKTDMPLKTGMNLCIRVQEMNRATKCKEETWYARNLSVSEVKWCRKISSKNKFWYISGIKHVMGDYP